MNKGRLNYWIDIVLAISFLICFVTGMLKWPSAYKLIGTEIYRNISMQKMSRLHDISGLIMGLLVFIHLALHWSWISSMTKSLFKKEN